MKYQIYKLGSGFKEYPIGAPHETLEQAKSDIEAIFIDKGFRVFWDDRRAGEYIPHTGVSSSGAVALHPSDDMFIIRAVDGIEERAE